jgi:dolichol-phosphate mannosyltransferase
MITTLVSIIIPTYNERENVYLLTEMLTSVLQNINYRIIFVDDSSPDGTANVIRQLKSKYPVELVLRPKKMGLSSAVMAGLKHTSSPLIVVMDADMQHDPQLVRPIINKLLEGYDLVIASRKVSGGRVVGWSPIRRIVSDTATALTHLFLPKTKSIKDPLSGFFGFNRRIITGVELQQLGFKMLLEILVKGNYQKIYEIPLIFHERRKGKSKLNLNEYRLFIYLLLRLMKYKYPRSK